MCSLVGFVFGFIIVLINLKGCMVGLAWWSCMLGFWLSKTDRAKWVGSGYLSVVLILNNQDGQGHAEKNGVPLD